MCAQLSGGLSSTTIAGTTLLHLTIDFNEWEIFDLLLAHTLKLTPANGRISIASSGAARRALVEIKDTGGYIFRVRRKLAGDRPGARVPIHGKPRERRDRAGIVRRRWRYDVTVTMKEASASEDFREIPVNGIDRVRATTRYVDPIG